MSERINGELHDRVIAWIADEVSGADAEELLGLLTTAADSESAATDSDAAAAELADRFAGVLRFGTAGLRGPLRAGPNGMNAAVVRQAAAGLAAQLRDSSPEPAAAAPLVVIGYDGRHRSQEFAYDSARVLAAAGLRARLLPRLLPTPVLASSGL